MIILNQTKDGFQSLPTTEVSPACLAILKQKDALRIIDYIVKNPDYPRNIAHKLAIHEQKVYYHIRQLAQAGIIKKTSDSTSPMGYSYTVTEPSFFVKLTAFRPTPKIGLQKESRFLYPFIDEGNLQAQIIVGSPDPHGPSKARSRDGYYGIDFALFLGTFLHYIPTSMVKLDTETREIDLHHHLILLGGPRVNSIMAKLNNSLPIHFNEQGIYSTITKKLYTTDEIGMVLKTPHPLDNTKQILIIAGVRHAGTRAAILAILKYFNKVKEPNKKVFGHVVEGVDMDSDGIVDDVEFLE